MNSVVIHQTVHGYDRGHRLLAGSAKLSTQEADLLARLSDLSGAIVPGVAVPPYLSMFPAGRYYAISQTWLDEEAPRSGCVLTHTLLIESRAWGRHGQVRSLAGFLRKPTRREGFEQFSLPIDRTTPLGIAKLSERILSPEPVADFVLKFFRDGQHPVIWTDWPDPDHLAWALCDFAWSGLRQRLSICTFCLQPRALGDRSFQLMFVPSPARPRFVALPKNAFVESRPRSHAGEESWVSRIVAYLLEPMAEHPLKSAFALLGESCEPDPTLAQSLFLLQDLWARVDQSSTAGVAVLDIIDALGNRTGSLTSLQTQIVASTIESLHSRPPTEALQTLVLLNERLSRTGAESAQTADLGLLRSSVAHFAARAPSEALSAIASRHSGLHPESPYAQGLLDGLEALSREGRSTTAEFIELANYPDFARSAVVSRPAIALGFLEAMRRSGRKGGEQLAEWISAIATNSQRVVLRRHLLRHIVADTDRTLVLELLVGIEPGEVHSALSEIAAASHDLSDPNHRDLVVDRLSNVFPIEVREWARSSNRWSFGIAEVVAATYEFDDDGLKQLMDEWPPTSSKASAIVAAYVGRTLSSRRATWFKELAKSDSQFLVTMLSGDFFQFTESVSTIQRLFNECSDMPVALCADLLPLLARLHAGRELGVVLDVSTVSVVREYVKGAIDESLLANWQAAPWYVERFEQMSSWQVENILNRVIHNTDEWHRAWRWIRLAPRSLYNAPGALRSSLRTLIFNRNSHFTKLTADDWRSVVSRARQEIAMQDFLRISGESLDFAFTHSWLPISSVVVEVFYPVYEAVSNSTELPDEIAKLFGMFTWDKAKELRSKLVESYYQSRAWPPGDLALAVRDDFLLRKVCKRLGRKWHGDDFIRSMITDLASRHDSEASWAIASLNSIANDPNFDEPWD